MSRKLGAIALAMAILVGAMEVKSVFTGRAGAVMIANGPDPVPTKNPFPKKPVAQPTAVPEVR
jgi:hypothetical protein